MLLLLLQNLTLDLTVFGSSKLDLRLLFIFAELKLDLSWVNKAEDLSLCVYSCIGGGVLPLPLWWRGSISYSSHPSTRSVAPKKRDPLPELYGFFRGRQRSTKAQNIIVPSASLCFPRESLETGPSWLEMRRSIRPLSPRLERFLAGDNGSVVWTLHCQKAMQWFFPSPTLFTAEVMTGSWPSTWKTYIETRQLLLL